MSRIEVEGLIEARLGLAQQLGILAEHAREIGQHHGLGRGRLGGFELAFVETDGLLGTALGGFQRGERAQRIGVVGMLGHRALEADARLQTVGQLIAEDGCGFEQYSDLLGLAGQRIGLAE